MDENPYQPPADTNEEAIQDQNVSSIAVTLVLGLVAAGIFLSAAMFVLWFLLAFAWEFHNG